MAMRLVLVFGLLLLGCGGPQALPDDDAGDDDASTPSPTPTPYPPESSCADSFDNDQDGLVDCDDPDCDMAILTAGSCGNEPDQLALCTTDINTVLQDCSGNCGTDANCYGTCMEANSNVSGACSQCFGQLAACVGTDCLWDCIDPNSSGCQNCVANTCWPLVESCGGTLACPGAICN